MPRLLAAGCVAVVSLVNDQDKALKFYTSILDFVKKSDIVAGEYRWLTVVSPDDQNGTELVLEPNANPAAKTCQKAIFEQSIPATSFGVLIFAQSMND